MVVDTIGDMLTRIRNAQAVGKETVNVSYSKINAAVLDLLHKNKFVGKVSVKENDYVIEVELIYDGDFPRIMELKRVSSPGLRMYASRNDLPRIKGREGLVVVSTSKGIMSAQEARKQNLGGEVICQILS